MARNAPSIDAYGDGGFRLDGAWHEGSLLILRDQALPWDVADLSNLTLAGLEPVLRAGREEVELVLLGAGVRNALPPRESDDPVAPINTVPTWDPPVVRQAYPQTNTPPFGFDRVMDIVTDITGDPPNIAGINRNNLLPLCQAIANVVRSAD